MKPIAIFYHTVFRLNDLPLPAAPVIVRKQMFQLSATHLLDAAKEMHIGVNGGLESSEFVSNLLPRKARIELHGLQCRNECRTIRMLEEWLPGHDDWLVFYFHTKGATKPMGDGFTGIWRRCMTKHCVLHWTQCVKDLEDGCDAVGCHWMEPPATPEGQYIFAGTFWWATGKYLLTLPSILERDRIKMSGIDSVESRYESEVWIGNGPRRPLIKDYHGPKWNPSKIETCK